MTTLIIARHGNTFTSEQTPTRVGARTDLPLVESGQEQARKIGAWLKHKELIPETFYSSQLQRTKQTAEIAIKELGHPQPVYALEIFNEIDYGPDENKPEVDVIKRIGKKAITDWDDKAIVPKGWKFDPDKCIKNWKNFARHIVNTTEDNEVTLVVTSNGIARFAPHLTGNFKEFADNHKIKLSTGALGILKFENDAWVIKDWNVRP
jgi:probable phosphoglycerate mutase